MTFSQLKLTPALQKAVREVGYEKPTPIQEKAIPPVLQGHDLLGCAQTGTGKTAAFALPILQYLSTHKNGKRGIRCLILTPTRELALQIGDSFAQYSKYLTLRTLVIFGGVGQQPQVDALKKGVDILVACPGRLNDLIGQGFISLDEIEIFVLDEADRMLDMGFIHDVKKVLAKLPRQRQNLLFSATMPKEIEQLAASFLMEPVFVKVDPPSSTVERIDQSLYLVEKADKKRLLPYLIEKLNVKNALVFSRTKHGANKIAQDLTKAGIPAAAIHGNKSQSARVAALEGFKAGEMRVLVATDIAARGIDINELSHVFNYDLPEVPETYVHRIGRTARAGADGTAISFCCPEELEYLKGIEKLNRKKIPVVKDHPWAENRPKAEQAPPPPTPSEREEAPMENNPNPVPGEGQGLSASARRRRRRKAAAEAAQQPKTAPASQQSKQTAPAASQKPPKAPKTPAQKQVKAEAKPVKQVQKPVSKAPQPQKEKALSKQSAPVKAPASAKAPASVKAQPAPKAAVQPKKEEPPKAVPQPRRQSKAKAVSKEDDPGLILISRRPPVQKFASFEEYMNAHGGETAPIVGWDEQE